MIGHNRTVKKLRVRKLHPKGGKKVKMTKRVMLGGNKNKMHSAPRAPEHYQKIWDRTEKAVKYHRTGDPSVGPEHLTVDHARAIRDHGTASWEATKWFHLLVHQNITRRSGIELKRLLNIIEPVILRLVPNI